MEEEERAKQAWGTLIACFVAVWGPGAVIFGYPGIAAGHWTAVFGADRAEVGATMFFVLGATGLLMYPVGRWQARISLARLILFGEILAAAAMGLAAFASSMATVYVWALGIGAASCFVYLPAQTAAQFWWPHRRGLASGAVNVAFAGSAALMAPVFRLLYEAWGYPGMNWAVAAGLVTAGAVAARFVAQPSGAPTRAGTGVRSLTARQALATPALRFLWVVWAFLGAAGIAMVTLATTVGRLKGFGPDAAMGLLVSFGAANGLSRVVTGALSDAIGARPTLCMASVAAGAAYACLPFAASPTGSAALTALVGVAFGTLFTVSVPLIFECFGPDHFAPVFGLVFTAYGFVSGLLGPWLGGYLLDRSHGNLFVVCAYLAVLCVAAGGLVLGVRPSPPRHGGAS